MLAPRALAPDGSTVLGFRFEGPRVTYEGREPVEAGIRFELELPATDDPRWLVPGVFYGENRPETCTRIYPRFTPERMDLGRMESQAWSFRADRCATPAVFESGRGLATSETSALGQSGVGFAWRGGRPNPLPYLPDPPRLVETRSFDAAHMRDHMHVSWVSGVPYAYALLRHAQRVGNGEYERAATAVLDHVAENLTPGGTFWSQWTHERGWTWGWHPDHSRLHARTLADAALFLRRAGERWLEAVRSNLDVVLRTQRDDGALPAAHHVESGDAVSWEGTAGMAWIPALVEAGHMEEARAAGEYFKRFDTWYGAPEDVDLAPTSEDGTAAVMAFVALEDWETARRAADWMLTFRYSYDVEFDPGTELGRYGFKTRGADQASPANQHLHSFGLICLPEMIRLAEATGDEWYERTTRENLACFRQFVARHDGDFGARKGLTTERYYQTDVFDEKGGLLPLAHAWTTGVLLYGCETALELAL